MHEGTWGIYVEFGIGATNIGDQASGQTLPAAIVPIINLGLQKFAADNPLAVDAAEVNPTSKKK
ncbi:MAG: hypothetical protein HOP18_28400 [Deltaproteobacteria bacterium]|nr:hypothetical protein [Deltaproteobacteria bacterium]